MALPKINHPISEVFLQSLGRNVKYRPFLVKEEKLLMIAKESQDKNDIKNAIMQVLQNCCLEEGLDVNQLPLFDVEMFFVHLRIKSVGESAKLSFTCENVIEPGSETVAPSVCGHITDYTLDLSKVKYDIPEDHSPIVQLTPTVGIKLKYPTISIMDAEFDSEYAAIMKIMLDNVEYIYDENSVYKRDTISDEELASFFEELNIDQIAQIRNFFNITPRAVLDDQIKCEKCGFEHKIHVGDLNSFFT